MNNKKFLNEEDYQRNKKKLVRISLIVLVLGILIGGGLILKGLSNSGILNFSGKSIEQQIEEEKQNLLTKKEEIEQEIQTTINGIQTKIDNLNTELGTLKAQKDSEFFSNRYYSEKYYSLVNDIFKKETEIRELEAQITKEKEATNVIDDVLDNNSNHCSFEAKNNIYTAKYCSLKNKNKPFNNIPYYAFGGVIIIASCMIACFIYVNAKRREILAFTAQQVMPVAKEGIDTMAPTIGNLAKEISKGIKDGIKDDNE